MVEQRRTVCRICHIACDLTLDIEAGRVKAVHGARDNPVYYGYSCIKGRTSGEVLSLPERLLGSLKRNAEGNFKPIASGEAIAQAAAKLAEIVARDGPRAVGMFVGTYISTGPLSEGFARALMRAIGSPMVFDNGTIDQPGKPMATAMHGVWLAGSPPMDCWDALLLVGSNPLISMSGGLGANPARTLKRARARGMRLVVIDPRRTECARQADVHLQIRPGEDAVVLAAIVREMIAMGGMDHAFVAVETQGLDALTEAVAPFTMAIAAARAGVDEADIKAAVELLAATPRGAVSVGTGGNMSGQSTIVEYLAKVITSLRGWWLRAGEVRPNPGVLIEPMPAIAATPGPSPVLPEGETMRVCGLR